MQYTVTINQEKAQEWGLNAQQAMLFAFVYEVPSWANAVTTNDGVFFALSKLKIIEELPLLTDKPDTAYRMLRALRDKGLLELSSTNAISLIRLTDKASTWNKKADGSEKNPRRVGKKSEEGRKNLRQIRIPVITIPRIRKHKVHPTMHRVKRPPGRAKPTPTPKTSRRPGTSTPAERGATPRTTPSVPGRPARPRVSLLNR